MRYRRNSRTVKGRWRKLNPEIEKFADYLIEWIVSKSDMEIDRLTEFNIVRMIVDFVELYEKGCDEK